MKQDGSLVAAVSNAGGIGLIGNALEPAAGTQRLIQATRAATPNLFGVDFLFDTSAFGPTVTDAHIDVCVSDSLERHGYLRCAAPGTCATAREGSSKSCKSLPH